MLSLRAERFMFTVHDLPAVNASLNALSGVLLLVGYILIARAGSRRIAR